ncbi:kinase-associated lipoprotein B [Lederbergia wuyishanensis]|uniref:Kinase-associated protein B n=1 Tax=Lederbergia wuyishanensis TaxID=1347903 RepID=A0ABU0D923_9BACI|nr:kinase-associated lipoprotein B [Lederbergia wuyishanensis]MCJ8009463.1 kinase-associated lipoprotein B [Lederbergia wuyishanensis]MDQ0344927.1 kinase-associated protein B [Lederbergia wuyishanensis]
MQIGQVVTAFNKTGKYIGEITAVKPDTYTVRCLAVLIHPRQGDLHNPNEADVPFFHERKALAFREQANIPIKMVKPYEDEIPDYKKSLVASVEKLKNQLETKTDDAYSVKSLQALDGVIKEYELMYSITF